MKIEDPLSVGNDEAIKNGTIVMIWGKPWRVVCPHAWRKNKFDGEYSDREYVVEQVVALNTTVAAVSEMKFLKQI